MDRLTAIERKLNAYYGHTGRPGKVGGSRPRNSISFDYAISQIKDYDSIEDYAYALYEKAGYVNQPKLVSSNRFEKTEKVYHYFDKGEFKEDFIDNPFFLKHHGKGTGFFVSPTHKFEDKTYRLEIGLEKNYKLAKDSDLKDFNDQFDAHLSKIDNVKERVELLNKRAWLNDRGIKAVLSGYQGVKFAEHEWLLIDRSNLLIEKK